MHPLPRRRRRVVARGRCVRRTFFSRLGAVDSSARHIFSCLFVHTTGVYTIADFVWTFAVRKVAVAGLSGGSLPATYSTLPAPVVSDLDLPAWCYVFFSSAQSFRRALSFAS